MATGTSQAFLRNTSISEGVSRRLTISDCFSAGGLGFLQLVVPRMELVGSDTAHAGIEAGSVRGKIAAVVSL